MAPFPYRPSLPVIITCTSWILFFPYHGGRVKRVVLCIYVFSTLMGAILHIGHGTTGIPQQPIITLPPHSFHLHIPLLKLGKSSTDHTLTMVFPTTLAECTIRARRETIKSTISCDSSIDFLGIVNINIEKIWTLRMPFVASCGVLVYFANHKTCVLGQTLGGGLCLLFAHSK